MGRSTQIRGNSANGHFRRVFWGCERPQKETTMTKSVLTPPNDVLTLDTNAPVEVTRGSYGKYWINPYLQQNWSPEPRRALRDLRGEKT